MWLVNYFRELKVWRVVKKVYKENRTEFERVGLKCDWFGRLYKVINRDASIPLGSDEDEELLMKELDEIKDVLIKTNVMDILAYELIPQEDGDENSFENGYLVTLTPAWDIAKQYVTLKSSFFLGLTTIFLVFIIISLLCCL